jgi:group II intron reverse transcriptase/maturase
MQSAETVLGVLRERGRCGLPLNEVYRQLFNPELYLLAYGRIYSNKGALTPGVTDETADGMSLGKIGRIIDALRHERYRFSPARRVLIPKKNGKLRPLGLPTWSDKLVGEVIRLLLEAYYEPTFSDHSHGFRPRRGCHTALRDVANTWTGTTWFIEADVVDCFGSLDHQVMLSTLKLHIHDERFLRLMRHMLRAGYLEDWVWNATLSGAPQGGVVSPVLSNIYLDRLDKFVDTVLIPEYTRGESRASNPAYQKVANRMKTARKRGDRTEYRLLRKQQREMTTKDPTDPGYRRLRYIRYADDELLGFTGPKAEAEEIKERLERFLRDELALELSTEKTLITHARTRAARFLGYDIITQSSSSRRAVNARIALRVPADVVTAKTAPYLTRGQPAYQGPWISHDDHTIVATYGSIYRGIVQYYLPAFNVHRLDYLCWVMETSMLKTLAAKHRSTVTKMATKHQATIATPHGPRRCFEARIERQDRPALVARFGGIPLIRRRSAVITDCRPAREPYPRKELITRLLHGRCEICTSTDDIHVHHVARLADLASSRSQPEWARIMAKRRRKTLVVCRTCYDTIRSGMPHKGSRSRPLESRMR